MEEEAAKGLPTHFLVVYRKARTWDPFKYRLFTTEGSATQFTRTLVGYQWQIKTLVEED